MHAVEDLPDLGDRRRSIQTRPLTGLCRQPDQIVTRCCITAPQAASTLRSARLAGVGSSNFPLRFNDRTNHPATTPPSRFSQDRLHAGNRARPPRSPVAGENAEMILAMTNQHNQWPTEVFHMAVKFAESMRHPVPDESFTRAQIIEQMLEFMIPAGNS